MRNRVRKLRRREKRDFPVGGWPPSMDVDEWEVLAPRMQDVSLTPSAELTGLDQHGTIRSSAMS